MAMTANDFKKYHEIIHSDKYDVSGIVSTYLNDDLEDFELEITKNADNLTGLNFKRTRIGSLDTFIKTSGVPNRLVSKKLYDFMFIPKISYSINDATTSFKTIYDAKKNYREVIKGISVPSASSIIFKSVNELFKMEIPYTFLLDDWRMKNLFDDQTKIIHETLEGNLMQVQMSDIVDFLNVLAKINYSMFTEIKDALVERFSDIDNEMSEIVNPNSYKDIIETIEKVKDFINNLNDGNIEPSIFVVKAFKKLKEFLEAEEFLLDSYFNLKLYQCYKIIKDFFIPSEGTIERLDAELELINNDAIGFKNYYNSIYGEIKETNKFNVNLKLQ